MKTNLLKVVLLGCVGLFLYSCSNSNDGVVKLVEERDSLKRINESQTAMLNDFGQTIGLLSETLDSIALQEGMLFNSNSEMPVTKEDVKYNLMRFEALLKKQGERIEDLEKQLRESKNANEQSLSLISHLQEQLTYKNRQIVQLKGELEKKNVSIAQLQELVESQRVTIVTQTATINELNQRTQKQGEALKRQDEILNNGYVLIGSKDDLKRKGIVKKGKLVSDAVMDRSKFAQIDIRTWTEVTFSAKRPRILTNMPVSSYEITTTGNKSFTLNITNPSDFWRISSYLVIQTD